jgi:cholesterol transport system auxiliary component
MFFSLAICDAQFDYSGTLCWRICLTLLLILGANGCTSTPINTYVLDVYPKPPATVTPGKETILVGVPKAEPGFDTPLIAYRQRPYGLDYFVNSRWVDTPAQMLHRLIVDTLESTHGFAAVLALPNLVEGDLRLDTTIIRLQQDFTQKPSQVRLVLQATLIDIDKTRLLGSRFIEATQVAPSEDAYGGVQAANSALQEVLAELQHFVLDTVANQRRLRFAPYSRESAFLNK